MRSRYIVAAVDKFLCRPSEVVFREVDPRHQLKLVTCWSVSGAFADSAEEVHICAACCGTRSFWPCWSVAVLP